MFAPHEFDWRAALAILAVVGTGLISGQMVAMSPPVQSCIECRTARLAVKAYDRPLLQTATRSAIAARWSAAVKPDTALRGFRS